MATIPIKSKVNLEMKAILEGIAQLDNETLEKFANAVNELLLNRKVPTLTKKETALLKKINEGISVDKLNRFVALQEILKEGKASMEEQNEFEMLVEYIELKEADRLKHLISLANLWKMTLPELRTKLGITPAASNV